jgi:tetratricopeptide (TPR) repeat protein
MPVRPRQHDIQTASVRAFKEVLPDNWTAQQREEDYGIDLDVEIFRDSVATGLRFAVQVKGTDDIGRGLSTRVKWTTRNYWSASVDPVLVVLWDSKSGMLWWRWAHHFDTYGVSAKGKEFTFGFDGDQTWVTETPDEIESEVAAWRAWSDPLPHFPLSVRVDTAADVAGVPAGELVVRLRQRLRNFPDFVRVNATEAGPLFISLEIAPDSTVVKLSGGPSNHLHHEGLIAVADEQREAFVEAYVADIMIMIAHHMSRMRLQSEASALAASAVAASRVATNPVVGLDLLRLLVDMKHIDAALELVRRVREAGDAVDVALTMSALLNASIRSPERDRVRARLLAWAERENAAGAGALIYNAARLLPEDDYNGKIELLDIAAQTDPTYLDRGYFWRERGGHLFLRGDFAAAAADYERAVGLGYARAQPLLADALLFNGEYQRAAEAFAHVVGDDNISTPEWRLKHAILRPVLTRFGVAEQHREVADAERRAHQARQPLELRSILQVDLLCGQALYKLGNHERLEGRASYDLLLMCALVDPHVAIAWLAAMRSVEEEAEILRDDVALVARRFCGEEIIDLLLAQPETQDLAAFVAGLFEQLPPDPDRPFEIRISDGTSTSVVELDVESV